jgi:hypothetical protein
MSTRYAVDQPSNQNARRCISAYRARDLHHLIATSQPRWRPALFTTGALLTMWLSRSLATRACCEGGALLAHRATHSVASDSLQCRIVRSGCVTCSHFPAISDAWCRAQTIIPVGPRWQQASDARACNSALLTDVNTRRDISCWLLQLTHQFLLLIGNLANGLSHEKPIAFTLVSTYIQSTDRWQACV